MFENNAGNRLVAAVVLGLLIAAYIYSQWDAKGAGERARQEDKAFAAAVETDPGAFHHWGGAQLGMDLQKYSCSNSLPADDHMVCNGGNVYGGTLKSPIANDHLPESLRSQAPAGKPGQYRCACLHFNIYTPVTSRVNISTVDSDFGPTRVYFEGSNRQIERTTVTFPGGVPDALIKDLVRLHRGQQPTTAGDTLSWQRTRSTIQLRPAAMSDQLTMFLTSPAPPVRR